MILVLPGQKYTPPGPQELELCMIPRWPRDSVNSDLLYWLLYNGGEFDLRQGLQSKLKTSSYPSGPGPMILRILVLFSSPFSSWEIPKYPFYRPNPYPTINAMTMTIYDHQMVIPYVGRQWHQMTGVLIGAMIMPNAFSVSSVTLRKPPCSKISGIPGQFSWAAFERIEGIPCNRGIDHSYSY